MMNVWSVINMDLSKYTINNMKERLEEKLILSKELVNEGEYKKRSNIISIVEKEWCFLQAESAEKCSENYIGLQRVVSH